MFVQSVDRAMPFVGYVKGRFTGSPFLSAIQTAVMGRLASSLCQEK
jgi:hypothetical protein